MGGEALGPVKAQYPSIGDCQDRELGVGGLVSKGRRNGIGCFQPTIGQSMVSLKENLGKGQKELKRFATP